MFRNLVRTAIKANSTTFSVASRLYSSAAGVKSLVLVEHDGGKIASSSFNAVTAATALGGDVTALVAGGANAKEVGELAAKIKGVNSVIFVSDPSLAHSLAEPLTPVILAIQQANKFSHIVASHGAFGKNVLPRVAAKLDSSPVSDVLSISSPTTFTRPIYAGNALAQIETPAPTESQPTVLTIRPTAFDKASEQAAASVSEFAVTGDVLAAVQAMAGKSKFVSAQISSSSRPELATARVVVAGGRGMKSGENFKLLEELADKLGGAVGATRAAVDAGFVPNELQVGQTGKVVAPELYIAVGISGAIQHLAGMKDSKTIVAINKDGEAPIFQVADFGLVADLFKAVPELTEKLVK